MVSGAKDRGFAPVFFQKLQMGAESSLFAPVISPERLLSAPMGLKMFHWARASKPTKWRAVIGSEGPLVVSISRHIATTAEQVVAGGAGDVGIAVCREE